MESENQTVTLPATSDDSVKSSLETISSRTSDTSGPNQELKRVKLEFEARNSKLETESIDLRSKIVELMNKTNQIFEIMVFNKNSNKLKRKDPEEMEGSPTELESKKESRAENKGSTQRGGKKSRFYKE